jgi:hypothetical protein
MRKKPPKYVNPETRHRAPEEPARKKTFRESWEYRSTAAILRWAVILLFVGYVSFTAPLSWTWVKTKWERHYPLEHIIAKAKYALEVEGDPEPLRLRISMRSPHEADRIIQMLEPYIGQLNGLTFILFSDWMIAQGRIEEAFFWRQYARFRIRFDSLRCGAFNSITTMTDLMNVVTRPEIDDLRYHRPDLVIKSLKDVLDYDEKHPAVNSPKAFCDQLTTKSLASENVNYVMVRESLWPEIRETLRGVTEISIARMERDYAHPEEKPKQGVTADGKPWRDYGIRFGPPDERRER